MTANRKWVRIIARWLARIDGVTGQLRLIMLGMTGISTGLVALNQYGLRKYAIPFILITGLSLIIYTYFYTEGGVWNQVQRDKFDMSKNFAHPRMIITQSISAYVIFRIWYNREPTKEEWGEIQEIIWRMWENYRDGIEVK